MYVTNTNNSVRVGFSVNNKIGKAVVRNKVKRRMRAYAAQRVPYLNGCQCVFVAKNGISELSYDELTRQMEKLFTKAGLIKSEEPALAMQE